MDKKIAFCILANTKSQRLLNKPFYTYRGKNLIKWMIDITSSLSEKFFISTDNTEIFKKNLSIKEESLIKDRLNAGPLGGIFCFFEKIKKDCLFLPCDMPLLKKEDLESLYSNAAGFDIVIFSFREKLFPLPGFYRYSVFEIIKKMLKDKIFKLSTIIERTRHKIIQIKDQKNFLNINEAC